MTTRPPIFAYLALAIVAIFLVVSTWMRMHEHRCRMWAGGRLNCSSPATAPLQ